MTTFVYNDVEVKKTGRTATKAISATRTLTIVEVTPVNENDGFWKKFVAESALFSIQEQPKGSQKLLNE